MDDKKQFDTSEVALEKIMTTAVQIPGVKVDRNKFLAAQFAGKVADIQAVVENGPVVAGCSRELLSRMAAKQILVRTGESSAASFVAGIPGGLALAATIPLDVLQFFAMALRLAQELSYIYGAADLWQNGEIDDEKVRDQLILYCGVMFGVSGAVSGVRLLSSQIAKTTLKKLPQQALTKTFWYPIVRQIGKAVGVKVTKSTVAGGLSKAIPVIGGVISGSLNFASMMPMGKKLAAALDEASFDYTESEILSDFEAVQCAGEAELEEAEDSAVETVKDSIAKGISDLSASVSGMFSKLRKDTPAPKAKPEAPADDAFVKIEKLAKLRDMGAITQDEFDEKKSKLLADI